MLTFPSLPHPRHVRQPQRALKVNLLLRRQKLNSLTFLKSPKSTLPVHDVIHTSWSHFLSGVLFWHLWMTREHLRSCLHLTNPCTKRKVLSLTKPKGKIYKMKSCGHYITIFLILFCHCHHFVLKIISWKCLPSCDIWSWSLTLMFYNVPSTAGILWWTDLFRSLVVYSLYFKTWPFSYPQRK